jgi:hypothetical protein
MTEFQPKPQTPEQVDQGLRDAFRQAIKDGVMDATPYFKQMTFKSDIEKTEAEIKVLQKKLELLKEIETHKSQPRMNFLFDGKFEVVSYNKQSYYRFEFPDEVYWYRRISDENCLDLKLVRITDGETYRLLEGVWFNDVKKGKYDEPYCPDEPEYYDEVEWDEKDNPKPLDDVVNRLIEKHKSQKLWNILSNKYDYISATCDDIVSAVEEWLPKEQSAAGSQNVDTELLVDGFNHCLDKIKGKLR